MDDSEKSKEQLIVEIEELRSRLSGEVSGGDSAEEEREAARFDRILEQFPYPVEVGDNLGNVIFVNQPFLNMFGIPSADMIIGTYNLFRDPLLAELGLLDSIRRAYNGELVFIPEVRIPAENIPEQYRSRREGEIFQEVTLFPIFDGAGELLQTVTIFKDITDRKEAERELSRNQQRLEDLLRNTPLVLYVCNPDSPRTPVYISPNIKEALDYSVREWLDDPGIWSAHLHPEDSGRVFASLEKLPARGKLSLEYRLMHRDGRYRWFRDELRLIGNDRGEVVECVGFFIDITDHKVLEEELLKTCKVESLGTFAGGIAHDFNNLLTAILGNITLAKMNIFNDEDTSTILREAEEASLRAKVLTRQLLTFSRAGEPVKKKLHLPEIVSDGIKIALRGSDAGVEYVFDPELLSVEADAGQIGQVLHNIITIGLATGGSGRTIRVICENVSPESSASLPIGEGRFVRVVIEDPTLEISRDKIGKIFDPFVTSSASGGGPGLFTSLTIIKKHGGNILVERGDAGGTRFLIYLPAAEVGTASGRRETAPPRQGEGRILVMDDEEIVRRVSGKMLRQFGYTVDFAVDGVEAIEKYRQAMDDGRPYAAVILDLTVVDGMGGAEAVRKLIALDVGVRAIVASGYANDPIMSDYRKHGFRAGVGKPYEVTEFIQTLQDVLSE